LQWEVHAPVERSGAADVKPGVSLEAISCVFSAIGGAFALDDREAAAKGQIGFGWFEGVNLYCAFVESVMPAFGLFDVGKKGLVSGHGLLAYSVMVCVHPTPAGAHLAELVSIFEKNS
jgi:hypothetical protein